MSDILIFAGTMEGRKLAEYLAASNLRTRVCVATEYGERLLPKGDNIFITSTRLDFTEMTNLMLEEQVSVVVDATHPYAVIASENIKKACKESGREYLRLLRSSINIKSETNIYLESVEAAAEYLKTTEGNVLITTGSKELSKYTCVADYKTRFYARVLSTSEVVSQCAKLGFEGKNLICMQGPFSEELNYAMLKQIDAKYLVTKESGSAGGFLEKINAAELAGAKAIVIGRPIEEAGISYEECLKILINRFGIQPERQIYLVGIGMGSYENMTIEVVEACKNTDILIGARRILEALEHFAKPVFEAYQAADILDFIINNTMYKNIVIALSGDTGFYSGAKKLAALLSNYKVKVLPGISSCMYLCAALKTSWEEVEFFSIHGRKENILSGIKNHEKVFALLGGNHGVTDLCQKLIDYRYEEVILYVGEQLSYPEERITKGMPFELVNQSFAELCAVLIENKEAPSTIVTHGYSDKAFIRGKVPMTKEEIRSISISKMKLKRDSIIYDIGAGTGSVSIEMALQAVVGSVYAIEKNKIAIGLIEENKRNFGVDNLIAIEGTAPEAMHGLPIPTHAFIGGSSGKLKDILCLLLKLNPYIHIVINVITLETITEAVACLKTLEITNVEVLQVSIAKSQELGGYHMMMGQNPVYIISCTGGKKDAVS